MSAVPALESVATKLLWKKDTAKKLAYVSSSKL